ncbi:hypothetical protein D3C78_1494480 [compost metagenome]
MLSGSLGAACAMLVITWGCSTQEFLVLVEGCEIETRVPAFLLRGNTGRRAFTGGWKARTGRLDGFCAREFVKLRNPVVSHRSASEVGGCYPRLSMAAGMPKTTRATLAFIERFDDIEMGLYHRHQHQLRNALTDGDGELGLATVPAGNHQLALVVRVDQADQVT